MMCLTMSVSNTSMTASCSLLHTYSAALVLTFTLTFSSHANTCFPQALPAAHILTYGNVEAINAEGGTPTLSESMLFGVCFHGTPPVAPASYTLSLMPLVSCGVLFQFRLVYSPCGEEEKM